MLLLTGRCLVLLECWVWLVKALNWQTDVGKVCVESAEQKTGVLRVLVSV